ncbi:MAG: 4-(cytidine 5'-diphospho)-2-C-methyl-D-erythritol kinase [Kordiimonadaceae bacterium]|nr:4-(cytidine 5'-diphospho)-2-C-methyl-D-erythritol kinase [Kordiimonadaceae bacterium]
MLAPAKINLDLRITGRRSDGYHLLDSIVVFTEFGDELRAELSDKLEIIISGPFASGLRECDDNLVIKACKLLCQEAGVEPNLKFYLTKNMPVSSGIGGGSADAAAAMKLTCELLDLNINDNIIQEIAIKIGADVPVCLRSVSSQICGIGDEIHQLSFDDELYLLLINPGIPISTSNIFKKYQNCKTKFDTKRRIIKSKIQLDLIICSLKDSHNSFQGIVCRQNEEVQTILEILKDTEGLLLCSMSGSGATCFAAYKTLEECNRAGNKIKQLNNEWWIKETKIL